MTAPRQIDFRQWLDASATSRRRLAEAIGRAVTTDGFFYATHTPVTTECATRLFRTAGEFFALDEARKMQRRFKGEIGIIGYMPLGKEGLDEYAPSDLKEVFTVPPPGGEWSADAVETVWTGTDDPLRAETERFGRLCFELAIEVFRALALAFDLPEEFFARCHRPQDQGMRLFHYFPAHAATAPQQLGCGAHRDHGSLSLVVQDAAGGLEYVDDGGEWRAVPPVAGSVLVNPGDMLARWTGGVARPARHRVVAAPTERFSVGYFLVARPDTALDCPPTKVLPGTVAQPSGMTADEFLLLRALRRYDRYFDHHGLLARDRPLPSGLVELRGRIASRLGIEASALEQRLDEFGDVDAPRGAHA